MRFSIVIPTYNRKTLLRRCLAAATAQDYPDYEIIVVDDGSTDGTGEMVRREFSQVRYIRQESNRGPAAARNRGIEVATGEIIAFTDDDCLVPSNWLTRHIRHYVDNPSLMAVGGPQVPLRPNFYDYIEMAHYAQEYFGQVREINALKGWEGLATSNMSVRREAFKLVGYFDERFITGADPEFARRIVQAGYPILYDPSLQVRHLKVHTFWSYIKMRFRRGYGCVANDIKYHKLSIQRFIPFPNAPRLWREWHQFKNIAPNIHLKFIRFWVSQFIFRWVDVSGRFYYYLCMLRSK